MTRFCLRFAAFLTVGLTTVWGVAYAAPINDSINFQTTNQSMWSEGPQAVFDREVFLGTKWGTYDGGAPERAELGGIAGEESWRVPGTGGTIPNPVRVLWDGAMATCQILSSRSTCINGTSAVRACAPSWLGGGCATVFPAVPGLGSAPPATIENPIPGSFIDTRTGLVAGVEASGEAGIIPWVRAEGGGIDIDLPVTATIDIPDNIVAGTNFIISTNYGVGSGAVITANAPSFAAGVDGVFNSENRFFGTACFITQGCTSGSENLNVTPGRFGIVSVDLAEDNFLRVGGGERGVNSFGVPGIGFDQQYSFHLPNPANPDGVDDETTPQPSPSPTPRIGDFTVSNLSDLSGGSVSGNKVSFTTDQRLLSLNASITGIGEALVGSPGVLSNSIDLGGPLSIDYTVLDVGVGPRVGMRQEFGLDPNAKVRLEFDQPLVRQNPDVVTRTTRTEIRDTCIASFGGTCFVSVPLPVTITETTTTPGTLEFIGNVVEIALGDVVELQFQGEVGNLVNRTYFLDGPDFSNRTAATLDPGIKIDIGCIAFSVFSDTCAISKDFATTGLVDLTVYDKTFALGGFNEVSFAGGESGGPGDDGGNGGNGGNGGVPVSAPSPLLLLGCGLLLLHLRFRRQKASATS